MAQPVSNKPHFPIDSNIELSVIFKCKKLPGNFPHKTLLIKTDQRKIFAFFKENIIFLPEKILCGVLGDEKHSKFIQKMRKLSIDLISFYPYPESETTELWIIQGKGVVIGLIKSARKHLKNVENAKNSDPAGNYKNAQKDINCAIQLITSSEDDKNELENAIKKINIEFFKAQQKFEKEQILSPLTKTTFDVLVDQYRESDDFLDSILKVMKVYSEEDSSFHLTQAIANKVLGNVFLSAKSYLYLAENTNKSELCINEIKRLLDENKKGKFEEYINFLETIDRNRIQKLFNHTQNEYISALLLQKDAIKVEFEKSLKIMKAEPSSRKDLTCYLICPDDEYEVNKWIDCMFAPHLTLIGIQVICKFWNLSYGGNPKQFIQNARTAGLTIVICTPSMKKACSLNQGTNTLEIQMTENRLEEVGKIGTTFIIVLNGEKKDCLPSPILEPIHEAQLQTINASKYYSTIFPLLAALKGLATPNKKGNAIKELFLEEIKEIILENKINEKEITSWRQNNGFNYNNYNTITTKKHFEKMEF